MTTDSRSPTALDLPPVAPLPEKTRRYFAACREKLGLVPNVLRAYAFDIDKLDAFIALYNEVMLADSGLAKLEREMIAVVVSSINRCHYCVIAHGAAVRKLSGDAELADTLAINYRLCSLEDRQRAMLDFAARMTLASHSIETADLDMLRNHGFSDRDIWDIAAVASFFNMTNRMASATRMVPNADYYTADRPT